MKTFSANFRTRFLIIGHRQTVTVQMKERGQDKGIHRIAKTAVNTMKKYAVCRKLAEKICL